MSETRDTAQRTSLRAVRARQREEFGGVDWGAASFGWLVAIGLGALLAVGGKGGERYHRKVDRAGFPE
jgi:hypothetical protein